VGDGERDDLLSVLACVFVQHSEPRAPQCAASKHEVSLGNMEAQDAQGENSIVQVSVKSSA
jgi:hypothetical protein